MDTLKNSNNQCWVSEIWIVIIWVTSTNLCISIWYYDFYLKFVLMTSISAPCSMSSRATLVCPVIQSKLLISNKHLKRTKFIHLIWYQYKQPTAVPNCYSRRRHLRMPPSSGAVEQFSQILWVLYRKVI